MTKKKTVNPWDSSYHLGVPFRPTWHHIFQGCRLHTEYVTTLKSLLVRAQKDECSQYNYTTHERKGNDLNVQQVFLCECLAMDTSSPEKCFSSHTHRHTQTEMGDKLKEKHETLSQGFLFPNRRDYALRHD